MVDEMGHQVAMIEYPGISRDYILEMVHRFYDEYYFRPESDLPHREEGGVQLHRTQAPVQRGQVVPEAARRAQPRGEGSPAPAGARAFWKSARNRRQALFPLLR